jgi:hypothetical protein
MKTKVFFSSEGRSNQGVRQGWRSKHNKGIGLTRNDCNNKSNDGKYCTRAYKVAPFIQKKYMRWHLLQYPLEKISTISAKGMGEVKRKETEGEKQCAVI